MFRNMVAALFRHGKIITTPAKAKEARPFAERLITLAKRGPGDLAARRRAIRLLHDPSLVRSLFEDLGARYQERPGGYTRILHLSKTRVGDGARQVLFELVEGGAPAKKARGAVKAALEPARVETSAAAPEASAGEPDAQPEAGAEAPVENAEEPKE
jgi:large subunit ribosomal protein L17